MGLTLIWGLATRCQSMRQYSKTVQENVATAGHNSAGPSISDGRTDRQTGRQASRETDLLRIKQLEDVAACLH